ncbi:hypothetical protein PAPYR_5287 [Paratrimastix pyriformis]|uniref:Uncharacterized protein n=1 Tax=Paratrimastix pyriformis TaxID=342808 RepID=A0ABQ8UKN1_9EUKA|nr:hypothetical protein PAPYR_5287 [Paratrimastix pyriformis]
MSLRYEFEIYMFEIAKARWLLFCEFFLAYFYRPSTLYSRDPTNQEWSLVLFYAVSDVTLLDYPLTAQTRDRMGGDRAGQRWRQEARSHTERKVDTLSAPSQPQPDSQLLRFHFTSIRVTPAVYSRGSGCDDPHEHPPTPIVVVKQTGPPPLSLEQLRISEAGERHASVVRMAETDRSLFNDEAKMRPPLRRRGSVPRSLPPSFAEAEAEAPLLKGLPSPPPLFSTAFTTSTSSGEFISTGTTATSGQAQSPEFETRKYAADDDVCRGVGR